MQQTVGNVYLIFLSARLQFQLGKNRRFRCISLVWLRGRTEENIVNSNQEKSPFSMYFRSLAMS